ncbi:MAG: BTAD domain-containing putative transcriptional regulator [Myxococcota bacterium]
MSDARRLRSFGPIVACVTLIVVAYARAPLGAFVWDDLHLIVRNANFQSWSTWASALTGSFWSGTSIEVNDFYGSVFRPILSGAYLVQVQLFGENPVGYHLVSLALHVACTVLAIRWIERRVPSATSLGLFVGGLVFAIHPSRVEAVAWISGSGDLWMTLWVLLGLEAWDRRHAWLAGGLLGLAVLSKEAAVIVPLLIATDQILLGRERSWRRWAALGATLGLIVGVRAWLVPVATSGRLGLEEMPWRVLSTLGHFAQRTVVPWPQTVQPAARAYDSTASEVFAGWAIAVGIIVVVMLALLVVGSRARSGRTKPWLADALWYVVALAPTLSFIDIDALARASDRFAYLPMLGLSALLARTATWVATKGQLPRRIVSLASATIAISFVLLTALHVTHFRNDYTLWTHEYETDPTNTDALWALSGMAEHQGLVETAHRLCTEGFEAAQQKRFHWTSIRFALCQLETALEIAIPDDPETVEYVRDVYDDLMRRSVLAADRGSLRFDIDVRSDVHRKRLMADATQVALPRARAHLASGSLASAVEQLERVTRSYPRAEEGWVLLIAAYRESGDDARADATEAWATRLFGKWPPR